MIANEQMNIRKLITGELKLYVKAGDDWQLLCERPNIVVKTGASLLAKSIVGDTSGNITKLWLGTAVAGSAAITDTWAAKFAATGSQSLALTVGPTYTSSTNYTDNQAKLCFTGTVTPATFNWAGLTSEADTLYNLVALTPTTIASESTLMAVWTLTFNVEVPS